MISAYPTARAAKRAVIDPIGYRVPAGPTRRRCSVIEEVNQKSADQRTVAQLVTDLTAELQRLVRDEIRLAVFELKRKGKRAGLGAGMAAGAGLFALLGLATLVAAAVLALALVLPAWLAALIIGGGLLVLGGLGALAGRATAAKAVPPLPEEAIAGVRKDVETVREGMRS
jgi:uncharacterized membrane protein YqjE